MTHTSSNPKIPPVDRTGIGYNYVRCRAGGDDSTVYIHQLCAIADGADPRDVFSDDYDTHHRPLDHWLDLDARVPPTPIDVGDGVVPAIDTPDAVEVVPRNDHRRANLDADAFQAIADGGGSA